MSVLEPGRKLGIYTAVRARFIDDRTEVWEGSLVGLGGFAESVALVTPVSRRPDDLQDFAQVARQLEAGAGAGLGQIFAIEGGSPPYYACQGFDGPDLLAVARTASTNPPIDWRCLAALVAAAVQGVASVASAPLAFEADRIIVFRDEVRVVPTLAVTWSPLPTQLGRLLRALMLNANASDPDIAAVVRRCEQGDYATLEAALPDLQKIAAGQTTADATAWATRVGAQTSPAVVRSPTHPDPDGPPRSQVPTPKAPTPRAPPEAVAPHAQAPPASVAAPAPSVAAPAPSVAAPAPKAAKPTPTVSLPPPAPSSVWMELALVAGALALLLAVAVIAAVGLNIVTLQSPVPEEAPRPQRVWIPPPLPPPAEPPAEPAPPTP